MKMHHPLQGSAGKGHRAKGEGQQQEEEEGEGGGGRGGRGRRLFSAQLCPGASPGHWSCPSGQLLPIPHGQQLSREVAAPWPDEHHLPCSVMTSYIQGQRLRSAAGRALLPHPASLSQSPSAPCANRLQVPGVPRGRVPSHQLFLSAWDLPDIWQHWAKCDVPGGKLG